MTLYEYSQLGCIVMTLTCGITLMLIGNTKAKSSLWLLWAKWAISLALIVVVLFNLAEYALDLKAANQLISRAINASTLYTVTFILAIAFIPIVQEMPMINMRPLQTAIITLVCSVLIWVSPWCAPSLSTILSVSSLALYLIELMRVLLGFAIIIKRLSHRRNEFKDEEKSRYSYINLLWKCISSLLLFALSYVFLVMLSEKALAIYNFASLILWAYVFVTFVNLIINYQNYEIITESLEMQPQKLDNEENTTKSQLFEGLGRKLDQWTASRAFCNKGVTLTQVAEQLGTNRTYLSRYINSYYDCNFNAWLTRLRIDEAKRLLADSPTLSMEKISLQLGFTSKSQFMSAFKTQEGITPGQWRELNG